MKELLKRIINGIGQSFCDDYHRVSSTRIMIFVFSTLMTIWTIQVMFFQFPLNTEHNVWFATLGTMLTFFCGLRNVGTKPPQNNS